jgi:soluble lytic murein transglycosylase-like protein
MRPLTAPSSALSNHYHIAKSTRLAKLTVRNPIIPKPFVARYRDRSREMHRRFDINLLLSLACAIILAHPAPSLAASDETSPPAQNADIAQPEPEASPLPPAHFCQALASAAAANDLPIHFFTRLIWQESRFNPTSVSRAGAQGIAQFMPETARLNRLEDPFNPHQAIVKSAELLRELNRQFGNLGLAAAAYNAGPRASSRLARGAPGASR